MYFASPPLCYLKLLTRLSLKRVAPLTLVTIPIRIKCLKVHVPTNSRTKAEGTYPYVIYVCEIYLSLQDAFSSFQKHSRSSYDRESNPKDQYGINSKVMSKLSGLPRNIFESYTKEKCACLQF